MRATRYPAPIQPRRVHLPNESRVPGAPEAAGHHLHPLQRFLHAARAQRVRIGERVEHHGRDVAVAHRDAVLGPSTVRRLEAVEELLTDGVALVVLVEADPSEDRLPHHVIDPRVLERGAHVPRRIPTERGERRVHEHDAEPEAAVHERIGFRLVAGVATASCTSWAVCAIDSSATTRMPCSAHALRKLRM